MPTPLSSSTLLALADAIATPLSLDVPLLLSQIEVESSGDPMAFKPESDFFEHLIRNKPTAKGFKYGPLAACSYGLLQIMLETALEIGFEGNPWDLFDPTVGLGWGARYLAHLHQMAGSGADAWRVAVAAYNGGPAMVHLAESAWPAQVQRYVDRVFQGRI